MSRTRYARVDPPGLYRRIGYDAGIEALAFRHLAALDLDACRATFDRLVEAFARDLAAAKALHAPRADFDPEALGAYFLAVAQGSLLLMKAKKDRRVVESNLQIFRQQLLALLGKPAR